MRSDGYAKTTIDGYKRAVDIFYEYLAERKIGGLAELTKLTMKDFRGYLHYLKQENGKPLGIKTIADRIIALRLYFKIMLKNGHVLYDFSNALEVPRIGHRVPRSIMTADEVIRLLSLPDTSTVIGYRDRVMLELLYATGLRNSELRSLRVQDVNLEQGEIRINNGKGGVDRIVPADEKVCALIRAYIEKVRPTLASRKDTRPIMEGHATGGDWLFLGRFGNQLRKETVWIIVKRYGRQSGIEKEITCHIFRHSIATHLLEQGMDIRYIQELLGHKTLTTTQIYTRVAITGLRKAFRRFHPKQMRQRDRNGQHVKKPLTAPPR